MESIHGGKSYMRPFLHQDKPDGFLPSNFMNGCSPSEILHAGSLIGDFSFHELIMVQTYCR